MRVPLRVPVEPSRKVPLTVDQARAWFHYDPATGHLHRPSRRKGAPVGGRADIPLKSGYCAVRLVGTLCPAHRVVWLHVHGYWPAGQIDHINGDRSDNRIENLREATASQNKANTRAQRNSGHGLKGVTWVQKDRRWHARIQIGGKRVFLGGFATKEQAADAYREAALTAHGAFARV